jgi:hypothetical protein
MALGVPPAPPVGVCTVFRGCAAARYAHGPE